MEAKACLAVSLLCVLPILHFGQALDPFENGPLRVKHLHLDQVEAGNLTKNVDIWAPNEAGSFPVIYGVTSLAGSTPADAYGLLAKQVASHGYVFVLLSKIVANPIHDYRNDYIGEVVKWGEENIEQILHDAGFSQDLHPDFTTLVSFGHSAGNHVMVNHLKFGCQNFKAFVLLNPVDGADPFGIVDEFAITPGQDLNFEIPSVLVMGGLDPVPGTPSSPACAPEGLANTRFYDAFVGRKWLINATDYGHVDFFDPAYLAIVEGSNLCSMTVSGDFNVYRKYVGGEIVSFLKGILEPSDNCDLLKNLEDPTTALVNVLMQKSGSTSSCDSATCSWSPEVAPSL